MLSALYLKKFDWLITHFCAILILTLLFLQFLEDGKVFCWGWNKYGQVCLVWLLVLILPQQFSSFLLPSAQMHVYKLFPKLRSDIEDLRSLHLHTAARFGRCN